MIVWFVVLGLGAATILGLAGLLKDLIKLAIMLIPSLLVIAAMGIILRAIIE